MPAPPYRGLFRTSRILPCVVSLEDLRRLYADLSVKSSRALEQHLNAVPRPQNVSPEQFENLKAQALQEGGLTVTVQGADGEQVVASSEGALAADVIPDRINWIAFDSAASMQPHNLVPLNRFTLRLDFTEPPGFDTYNPWDEPTPNTSELQVIGNDTTWVTGVYESTLAFFRRRRRKRGWLHTHHSFAALNWLVGFPAGLWMGTPDAEAMAMLLQGHQEDRYACVTVTPIELVMPTAGVHSSVRPCGRATRGLDDALEDWREVRA